LERSVAAAYAEDEHFDEYETTMGGGDDGSVLVRARDGASRPPSPLAHLLASSAEELERDYLLNTSLRLDLTPSSLAMLHDFGESLASDAAGPIATSGQGDQGVRDSMPLTRGIEPAITTSPRLGHHNASHAISWSVAPSDPADLS
jgi:hypothetical protein